MCTFKSLAYFQTAFMLYNDCYFEKVVDNKLFIQPLTVTVRDGATVVSKQRNVFPLCDQLFKSFFFILKVK